MSGVTIPSSDQDISNFTVIFKCSQITLCNGIFSKLLTELRLKIFYESKL